MIPSNAAEDEALVVIQKCPPPGFTNLLLTGAEKQHGWWVWCCRKGNNNLSATFIIYSGTGTTCICTYLHDTTGRTRVLGVELMV
jgi:hypothetical protein